MSLFLKVIRHAFPSIGIPPRTPSRVNSSLCVDVFVFVRASLCLTRRAFPVAAMPKRVTSPKIACLDFSLQKSKMKLGVQVLVEDPEKLDAIRQRSAPNRGRLLRGCIDKYRHCCWSAAKSIGQYALRRTKELAGLTLSRINHPCLLPNSLNMKSDR